MEGALAPPATGQGEPTALRKPYCVERGIRSGGKSPKAAMNDPGTGLCLLVLVSEPVARPHRAEPVKSSAEAGNPNLARARQDSVFQIGCGLFVDFGVDPAGKGVLALAKDGRADPIGA